MNFENDEFSLRRISMSKGWRSSEVFAGPQNAGARALWKSMGYCDGDFGTGR